ncbi:MAG: hypothetical protein K6E10_09880 [Eubacterium sp.]|nr:hypothetical protein [Eubacterium sp.]
MIEKRSDTPGDEAEVQLADICMKSFMKRPALQEAPLISISGFMNNAIFVKNKPGHVFKCDAAFLMMVKSHFRWLISGTSRVLYFADRKLKVQSEPKEFPRIGMQPTYNPAISEVFQLEKAENAFFLCSKALTDKIGADGIEKALQQASSQDDWMRRVEEMAGDLEYAAQALILPDKKKMPITSVIIIILLIIIAILLLIFILK